MGLYSRLRSRLQAGLAELLRLRRQSVPYLTRFTTSNPTPQLPKLSEFPGLIFLQYSDIDSNKTEVTAYWISREAAVSSLSILKNVLQTSQPVAEGYIRQVKGREESWVRRVPVGHWILYAASVFGALVVIEDYFARLFEKPDVVLEIPGRDVVDILVTDEISMDLGITNRSRDVNTVVTFTAPSLELPDGKKVEHRFWSNLAPPPMGPSATKVVEVEGASLPAGLYKLTVAAEAKAGYFRSPRLFSISRSLKVWNLEPEALLESINPESPGRAWIKGKVMLGLGAPYGINCQSTIQRAPSVQFGFVDFPGVRTWDDLPDASTPGLEVRSRTFQAKQSFGGLTDVPFRIFLEATGDVDWRAILKKSSVVCERMLAQEGTER